MPSRRIAITNPLALHARAAARFVNLANTFTSRITVGRGSRHVDGKSILGLLLLAADRGRELEVIAEGPDEDAALDALAGLIERGFDET